MTGSDNAERGRSVVARWRILAERRLTYLVELYESGRWKIYYTEGEFIAIIREAREALTAWELLAPPETPASTITAEAEISELEKPVTVSQRAFAPPVTEAASKRVPPFKPTPAPAPVALSIPVSAAASVAMPERMVLASPFVEAVSANGVGAEHDLREA